MEYASSRSASTNAFPICCARKSGPNRWEAALLNPCPDLRFAEHRHADIAAQAQSAVRLQADIGFVGLAVLAAVDRAALEAVGIGGPGEIVEHHHSQHLAAAQRRIG